MSSVEIGGLFLAALLVLLVVRIPIAIAMLLTGVGGYVAISGWSPLLSYLKTVAYARYTVYDLSVIPLFLLMGQFASRGGLATGLFRAAAAMIGHWRGGLAMSAVGSCAAFGAVCGSSIATAATMGGRAAGAEEIQLLGPACGGQPGRRGTTGILIPPSVVLVIYAILARENISALFMAAFIPGVLAAIGYMIAIAIYVRMNPDAGPAQPKLTGASGGRAAWRLAGVPDLPAGTWWYLCRLVHTDRSGGHWNRGHRPLRRRARRHALGPVQGSAVRHRGHHRDDLHDPARRRCHERLPRRVAAPGGVGRDDQQCRRGAFVVLAGILILYLILGCVMDTMSMILLTIPIFFPLIMGLDFYGTDQTEKAIWFGILALMVVEIGMITPPVGMNVYVISSMARDVPYATPSAAWCPS